MITAALTANKAAQATAAKRSLGLADHYGGAISMDSVSPTPTSVYLYYDRNDILLYVGITSRGQQRQREHNSDKEWWPFVVRQEVFHHATRQKAENREREIIHRYRPPFNKQHNPNWRDMRDLYIAVAASRGFKPYDKSATKLLTELRQKVPFVVVSRDRSGVVVRSMPSHAPIATRLDLNRQPKPFIMTDHKVGTMVCTETRGDFVVITFTLRKDAPSFDSLAAHVKVKGKPFVPYVHMFKPQVDMSDGAA